jgi:hypothetical protein
MCRRVRALPLLAPGQDDHHRREEDVGFPYERYLNDTLQLAKFLER